LENPDAAAMYVSSNEPYVDCQSYKNQVKTSASREAVLNKENVWTSVRNAQAPMAGAYNFSSSSCSIENDPINF
jgi:hypothetical protein